MNKIGLVGKSLGHSASPEIFDGFFQAEGIKDWSYAIYEMDSIDELPALIREENLKGFNVTIPYKQEVFNLVDELSDEAQKTGAVNTVRVVRTENNVVLKGFNTDVFGFEKMLWLNDVQPKKCLVLGTGGASKAVGYVMKKKEVETVFVSRSPVGDEIGYLDVDEKMIKEFDLVVNTTPLGMYPNVETLPNIPYGAIDKSQVVVDLVYNPRLTLFLGLAEANGATVINGRQMLNFQAEQAWELFRQV